jgi:hypothetical protein
MKAQYFGSETLFGRGSLRAIDRADLTVSKDPRIAARPLRRLARHWRGKREDAGHLPVGDAGVAPEGRLTESIDGAVLGEIFPLALTTQ